MAETGDDIIAEPQRVPTEPVGAITTEPPAEPSPPMPAPSAPRADVALSARLLPATLLPLERLNDDTVFLLRSTAELADVAALATDIGRLGQLQPIEVRVVDADRLQVVTGFRRVAALRLLQRDKVLARLHTDLSDEDALTLSLAAAIHGRAVSREALLAARDRLDGEGRLAPASRQMLEKALADDSALGPEAVEEEVDADELAADVTARLGECNQDLSLLADVFGDLDAERKAELIRQLKYSVDLVTFLESK
jgi:ParB family transcriptional regulator, chromosome partitioning protein